MGLLGESRDDLRVEKLEQRIRGSIRVRALLSHENARRVPGTARSVYYKWQGTHWVLASLAELGFPRGDKSLYALRDHALALWLRPTFRREFVALNRKDASKTIGVPVLRGRARRCASQQGSALRYLSLLQIGDDRAEELVRLLLKWQWPDGGWNCDKNPSADTSSFMETLLPMRGLAAHAEASHDRSSRAAAKRAAEVFLSRRLYRRCSDGAPMSQDFLRLHYPLYYHYDVLGGLKGIGEAGMLRDPRTEEALDWLETRELPDGGWPADARFYRVSRTFSPASEFVDWGGTGGHRSNDWVTIEALSVLQAAGRLNV